MTDGTSARFRATLHRMTLGRPRHPGFPARPLLRPGVLVCRRGDGALQIGLDPGLALVAPDTPDTRRLLDGLREGRAPGPPDSLSPGAARLAADLLGQGLVIDGDTWFATLGSVPEEHATSVAATYADAGLEADTVLRRRAEVGVRVDASGLAGAADRLRSLLSLAGVAEGDDLVVVVRGTEPDRAEVDEWVRRDLPHVFLTGCEGRLRIGPFVVPGHTACLRCIDAHHTERDPRRSLVVQQYAARAGLPGDLPEPVHADLLDVAVGWLARDVTRWADRERPVTWSTTVDVDTTLTLPRTPWPRHAGCGCSWGQSLAV